ncbi:DUF4129 domain-containing protein [Streptomyces sp. NPDC057686]|uniref:DUF4129 domain-containing protein n=1 Tax=Streptomyces sp. NPDC057686 TaxID=3346212 RepID=UPI0036CB87B7
MMSTGGLITRSAALLPTAEQPPVTTPRDPAREAAERELSKPLYHQDDPGLLQRALDRFWEWVGNLFDHASGATPGGTLGLAAIAVLVALALAALWWRLGSPRRTATAPAGVFDDTLRSAADHRTIAAAHAAAGRWTEAVQERMRAVVRSLEERTLLDPRPGRTADEAAAEAAVSLPDHAEALRTAARTFDDVTYGGRPGDEAMYARLHTLDTTLARTKPILTGPPA